MSAIPSTARSLTIGPSWVCSSVPGPIRRAPIRSASRAANSPAIDSATRNRFAAVHAWPPLRILASIAPSTAASRSASARTMNGSLPPSSIEHVTIRSAACLSRIRPTSVEPVNESLRTRSSASAAVTNCAEWSVVSTFTTPLGAPASDRICARASAVSGVSCAGLSTTVQPAASAGPILRVAIAAGKFHGVRSRATPTGLRNVRILFAPDGAVRSAPSMRTASSLNHRKNSAA